MGFNELKFWFGYEYFSAKCSHRHKLNYCYATIVCGFYVDIVLSLFVKHVTNCSWFQMIPHLVLILCEHRLPFESLH